MESKVQIGQEPGLEAPVEEINFKGEIRTQEK